MRNYNPATRSAKELMAEMRRLDLLTPQEVEARIGGDLPEYLRPVMAFMQRSRDRTLAGGARPSDIAKAQAMTIASQRAGAMDATKIVPQITPYVPHIPEHFFVTERGKKSLRPEDAVAAWFLTPHGREAARLLDKGIYRQDLWDELLAIRDPWGNNMLRNTGALGKRPATGVQVIADAPYVAGKISDARDDLPTYDLRPVTGSLAGVRAGKQGFFQHFIGLGERPTVDAVEMAFLATGQPSLKGAKDEKSVLVREAIDRVPKHPKGSEELTDLYLDRIHQIGDYLPGTRDLPREYRGHITHHKIWDAAKGSQTTHAAPYEAMETRENPIRRTPYGYYVVLPRRFSLRGKHGGWYVGPYTAAQAPRIADAVRGGSVRIQAHAGGYYVHVAHGFRLYGTPGIGPFGTKRAASAVLAKVLPGGRVPAEAPARLVKASSRHERSRAKAEPAAVTKLAPTAVMASSVMPAEARDATGALRHLGYSAAEAKTAVIAAYQPGMDTDQILRKVFRGRAMRNPMITIRIKTGRIKNHETGHWDERIVRGAVPVEKARAMLTPQGFEKAMNRQMLTARDLRFEALAQAAAMNPLPNPIPLAPLVTGLLSGAGSAIGGGIVGKIMQRNPADASAVAHEKPTAVNAEPMMAETKYLGRWQATQLNPGLNGADRKLLNGALYGVRPENESEKRQLERLLRMGLVSKTRTGWYMTSGNGVDAMQRRNPAAPTAMSDAAPRADMARAGIRPRSMNPVPAVTDPDWEARQIAAGTYQGQRNPVAAQFLPRPLPQLSSGARSILKVEMPTQGTWRPWTQRQLPALRELYSLGLIKQTRQGFSLTRKGKDLRRKMNLRGRVENPAFQIGEAVSVPRLDTTGIIKDVEMRPGGFLRPPSVGYVDVKLRPDGDIVKLRPRAIRPLNPRRAA